MADLAVVAKVYKTPTLEQMGIDPVRMETLNELRKLGREMVKDFDKVFETFSDPKPKTKFKIHLTRRDATASVEMTVEDPQEKSQGINRPALLSAGTKRHWVGPRRASILRWKVGYRQKTRPCWIGSRPGGKQTNTYAYSKGHYVSGIKAREYGETMVKRWEKPVSKRLEKAARRGARKAKRQPGV